MLALFKMAVRHALRTRLLLVALCFAFFVHFVCLKFIANMSINFQGQTLQVGSKEALFGALFFQLFVGFFVSTVYGIWMVPYAHQGSRASLTHVLPVSRWVFATVYSLSFILVLGLLHLTMVGCLIFVYGAGAFSITESQWTALLLCLLLQSVAFLMMMNGFAVCSMWFGQIPSFFLGLGFLLLSYIGSFLDKAADFFIQGEALEPIHRARLFYSKLPPLGELPFDVKQAYRGKFDAQEHLILWCVWLVICVLALRWKLRYPTLVRSSES